MIDILRQGCDCTSTMDRPAVGEQWRSPSGLDGLGRSLGHLAVSGGSWTQGFVEWFGNRAGGDKISSFNISERLRLGHICSDISFEKLISYAHVHVCLLHPQTNGTLWTEELGSSVLLGEHFCNALCGVAVEVAKTCEREAMLGRLIQPSKLGAKKSRRLQDQHVFEVMTIS